MHALLTFLCVLGSFILENDETHHTKQSESILGALLFCSQKSMLRISQTPLISVLPCPWRRRHALFVDRGTRVLFGRP